MKTKNKRKQKNKEILVHVKINLHRLGRVPHIAHNKRERERERE
jgi:hypothetical protein